MKLLVAIGLAGLIVSSTTQAALIDQGATTLDTGTGLVWLDITSTMNRSYNDVSSKFGLGQEFEGYRYATVAEEVQFWNNAGIVVTSGTGLPANVAPADSLLALIGSPVADLFGLTGDLSDNSPGRYKAGALWGTGSTAPGGAVAWSINAPPGYTAPNMGSWLVAVPEPTALASLALGSTLLLRRRMK